MKLANIAFETDSPEHSSGYANVMRTARDVFASLIKSPAGLSDEEKTRRLRIYDSASRGGLPREAYGYIIHPGGADFRFVMKMLSTQKPDLFFVMKDLFGKANDYYMLKQGNPEIPFLGHYPISVEALYEQDYQLLQQRVFDGYLLTTKWATGLVEEALKRMELDYPFWYDYAYHPVNENIFQPVENASIEQLKNVDYVITMVQMNRDGIRKNILAQLKAVLEVILETRGKVGLYIHAMNHDPISPLSVNITNFIQKNFPGLEQFVKIAPIDYYITGVPQQTMARLYSASDLVLMCTSGEGFGLPSVEAMMCGTPVLGSNNTATKEIVGGMNKDWLVPANNKIWLVGASDLAYFNAPKSEDIKKGIYKMMDSYRKEDGWGEKAREYAIRNFGMENAGKRLGEKVQEFVDWYYDENCRMIVDRGELIRKLSKNIVEV